MLPIETHNACVKIVVYGRWIKEVDGENELMEGVKSKPTNLLMDCKFI